MFKFFTPNPSSSVIERNAFWAGVVDGMSSASYVILADLYTPAIPKRSKVLTDVRARRRVAKSFAETFAAMTTPGE